MKIINLSEKILTINDQRFGDGSSLDLNTINYYKVSETSKNSSKAVTLFKRNRHFDVGNWFQNKSLAIKLVWENIVK